MLWYDVASDQELSVRSHHLSIMSNEIHKLRPYVDRPNRWSDNQMAVERDAALASLLDEVLREIERQHDLIEVASDALRDAA